jgi:hypothetical protein
LGDREWLYWQPSRSVVVQGSKCRKASHTATTKPPPPQPQALESAHFDAHQAAATEVPSVDAQSTSSNASTSTPHPVAATEDGDEALLLSSMLNSKAAKRHGGGQDVLARLGDRLQTQAQEALVSWLHRLPCGRRPAHSLLLLQCLQPRLMAGRQKIKTQC